MTERVRTAEVRPPLIEIETGTDLVLTVTVTGTETETETETGPSLRQAGTGTGNVQILPVTAVALGTMGGTQLSLTVNLTFGTTVSVASSGSQPRATIGTTRGVLSRTGRDVVTCTSCRPSCRGTTTFSRTTREWSKGERTSTRSTP